jgi:hypothetical protein
MDHEKAAEAELEDATRYNDPKSATRALVHAILALTKALEAKEAKT